jgi:hypothetical protein
LEKRKDDETRLGIFMGILIFNSIVVFFISWYKKLFIWSILEISLVS